MRVTSIDLYDDRLEENLRFSLQHADPFDKYMIRQIVGLDAEELIPRFYGFGFKPQPHKRHKFFDFKMKPREVAMRVVLNPNFKNNETYSDVRDELYKMISSTRTGQMIMYFNAGATTIAQLTGSITKFEAGYFNALPEVQITVRCENPMFTGVAPIIYDLEDDAYPDPIVEDGFLLVPDSLSTSPHGFSFWGTYTSAPTGHFRMRDTEIVGARDWEFHITYPFAIDDELHFSSVSGEKTLYKYDASIDTTFLLDEVSAVSIWPIIFPGQNAIFCDSVAEFEFRHVEYYPTYWGV